MVDTYGTGVVADDDDRAGRRRRSSTCAPAPSSDDLDLRRPIYEKTAAYGHFGRNDPDFTWEATNRADELKAAVAELS